MSFYRHKSMKRSAARTAEDDYRSGDGFVVGSDTEDAPLVKRAKTTTGGRKENTNSGQKKKLARTKAIGNADIDDNGEIFWEISNSRRVTISEFKGKRMISIREYYERDGKHLPGRKGISMLLEQYSKFMAIVPEIEAALKAKGEEVARPVFDNSSGGDDGEGGEAEEDDGGKRKGAGAVVTNGDGNRNGVKKDVKKNFEATSDEEEAASGDE